jgi:hypothetical protein
MYCATNLQQEVRNLDVWYTDLGTGNVPPRVVPG